MGYFILEQDPRIIEQPAVLQCPADFDPEQWIAGRVMNAPKNPIRFVLSPRSPKYRGCIIGGIATLFHNAFQTELTRLGVDNIQYFPIELENPEGGIETTYFLANVIGMFEAVDVERSVIEPMAMGGRGWLKSFTVNESATQGKHIFRITEAPTLIIINETLREELLKFDPSGVLMLPTERYDGWHL